MFTRTGNTQFVNLPIEYSDFIIQFNFLFNTQQSMLNSLRSCSSVIFKTLNCYSQKTNYVM